MKKVANRTQNSGTPAASLSATSGASSKDASPALIAGGGVTTVSP
jgi:hypothetical protein